MSSILFSNDCSKFNKFARAMGNMIETVKHRKKESTFKWFIIGCIPILNLYWLWKVAELISAHEKTIMPEQDLASQEEKKRVG